MCVCFCVCVFVFVCVVFVPVMPFNIYCVSDRLPSPPPRWLCDYEIASDYVCVCECDLLPSVFLHSAGWLN